MPSRVANGTAAPRFELPALDLNFGSITDGTNIPPPPASPVQRVPTPPQTPPANKDKDAVKSGAQKPVIATNGNLAGTKRPAEEPPVSPAMSGRPGSLRRLFSRTMLNNAYAEGQVSSNGAAGVNRPVSQSGGSIVSSVVDDRKAKRSSGWFRRLRTGDATSRRSSLMFEEASTSTTPKKPSGPPPPMIPELVDLEKDEGALGGDLFKNIK